MSRPKAKSRIAGSALRKFMLALLLLVSAGASVLFAPSSVGGRVTYATTSGASMEPELQSGDLLILRRESNVEVGDIAAYRMPETGQVVIHRVIAEADGRLTFKGDNNWWVDGYEPAETEILGTLWIHVGGLPTKPDFSDPSILLGGASAIVGVAVVLRPATKTARRRYFGRDILAKEGWQVLLLLLVVAGGCAGALAIAAFRSNTTVAIERNWEAQHSGAFSYEGAASPSVVYEGDVVRTGQPIFVDLVPRLDASFTYDLSAPGAENVRGTIRLFMVTRDINGWERSRDFVGSTAFEGTQTSVSTEIELAPLMAAASEIQRVTGSASRYLTSAVTAEVQVSGTVGGQPFNSVFAPFFTLRVTPPNEVFVETALTRDFENAPPSETTNVGNVFRPIQKLTLPIPDTAPATMDLLFGRVLVSRVRWVASSVALGALVAALGVATLLVWGMRSPAVLIRARYGDRLVRVSQLESELSGALRVETFEDLARIADRYQALILWDAAGDRDVFAVRHDGGAFVYEAPGHL